MVGTPLGGPSADHQEGVRKKCNGGFYVLWKFQTSIANVLKLTNTARGELSVLRLKLSQTEHTHPPRRNIFAEFWLSSLRASDFASTKFAKIDKILWNRRNLSVGWIVGCVDLVTVGGGGECLTRQVGNRCLRDEGQKRFKYSSGIQTFEFVLMYFQLQFQHRLSRLISLEQLSDYLRTRGPARCHPRDGGRLEHLVTAALGKHRWQITRPHQENNNTIILPEIIPSYVAKTITIL